jgi:hypothetical protein
MSHSFAPPRGPRPSERPSSRPVEPAFVARVRDLWVHHDPMRLAARGDPAFDLYDHQAYVSALCADEILSAPDAEQIITKIVRNEFGTLAASLGEPEFIARVQGLAVDLFAAVQERAQRPSNAPHPAR